MQRGAVALALWLGTISVISGAALPARADKMADKRRNMVEKQIEDRGIREPRVLDAMRRVERHLFVPQDAVAFAYDDAPLRIGYGQTISQPYIVALMTELIEPGPEDRVLEIGTGSGYQAAVLSLLVDSVYTIEIVEELGWTSEERLDRLGYGNVRVRVGDGYLGWPEEAPFDKIILTAAPPEVPQALVDQLADGGLMVLPVGTGYQELIVIEKRDGKTSQRRVAAVRFVPMVHGDDEEESDR
jgi:protein-L-isoaspartate(D-aspartate) O-methyltransferase